MPRISVGEGVDVGTGVGVSVGSNVGVAVRWICRVGVAVVTSVGSGVADLQAVRTTHRRTTTNLSTCFTGLLHLTDTGLRSRKDPGLCKSTQQA